MSKYFVAGAKFSVIFLALWILLCYLYGEYYLIDNIVPSEDLDVSEWLAEYYVAGGLSAFVGLVISLIWFWRGCIYDGETNIGNFYLILIMIIISISIVIDILVIPHAIEGGFLPCIFVVLISSLGYWLSSILFYAAPVKYIPWGAVQIHR